MEGQCRGGRRIDPRELLSCMADQPRRLRRRLLNTLYQGSALSGALTLIAICSVITLQVIFNAIDKLMLALAGEAIGLTVPSYSEISGLLLASGTFLALGYTFRQAAHIQVTLVLQHLPDRVRQWSQRLSFAIAIGMVSFLTFYMGFITWEAWIYQDVTPGIIPIPLWIPQCSMTLGSAILCVALVDTACTGFEGTLDA